MVAVLATLFACARVAPTQEPSSRHYRGTTTRPITLAADQLRSWTDGNIEILLLQGHVAVEQGLFRATMERAVVWLGPRDLQSKKPFPVTIYGDGRVAIDDQGKKRTVSEALLELQTGEELRLRSLNRTAGASADDPFFRRAVDRRQALQQAATSPVAKTTADVVPAVARESAQPRIRTIEVVPTQLTRPEPAPPVPEGETLPAPTRVTAPIIRISPRGSSGFQTESVPSPDDSQEQITIISGGINVVVEDPGGAGIVDITTDRAVVWTRKQDAGDLLSTLEGGRPTQERIEFYLQGHVEIRQAAVQGPQAGQTTVLFADEAYYDVNRNVAILINSELITTQPGIKAPIHLRAKEIRQVGANRFEAFSASVFASLLPSDPDLTVESSTASVERRIVPRRGWFGRPITDPHGNPVMVEQLWATAGDLTVEVRNVPILYLPFVQGDLRDPLGPIEQVRFRQDRVFGTGLLVDLDVFRLVGAEAPPDTKWTVQPGFLSRRGPSLGTDLETRGSDLFGLRGPYHTLIRGWAIHDNAPTDILGGPRDIPIGSKWRGRFLARHRQEIGDEFTFLGQFSYLSDRNFLEQYFKREFDNDINQETFVYLKQQRDSWAWSVLTQYRIREWVTETSWLPRADGYILGWSFFDRLTYFARANAGYAVSRTSSDIPGAFFFTPFPGEFLRTRPLPPSSDMPHFARLNTGRFDLWQELDLPFNLGPFRLVPYGIFDVTHYTETLPGDPETRLYGGGGIRGSIPFTRYYPNVCSPLFNVNGIAHKITLVADYRLVDSNVVFRELRQLDRLDDDATDQARRDLRAFRLLGAVPGTRPFLLATSPLFDPQLYAIRRGLEYYPDTLDSLQVLRGGIRQRWQTKRGFPGRQRIIDWMILDLEASFFPDADRDNFGNSFGLLGFDYTWHIGDRTTIISDGWMDPFDDGARYFNIGVFLDRPKRIQFYFGYRMIDPVGTDAIIYSTRYAFSSKWSMALATTYDFGEQENLGNSLILTRTGSDLQVSIGLNYQPLQNNFGFVFEIIPTLASSSLGHGKGLNLLRGR